jgi:hypothetical protein
LDGIWEYGIERERDQPNGIASPFFLVCEQSPTVPNSAEKQEKR